MTDYTPAKPIEAGCLAYLLPGKANKSGRAGTVVKVIELVTRENLDRDQTECGIGHWRFDEPHPRGGYWCAKEKRLIRIDDPGEEVSESTRESIPAEVG